MLALLAAGCVKTIAPPPTCSGPTDPMDVVIERINQRNARIDSLWAEGDFSAKIVDPKTREVTTPPSGNVILLYQPKHNLRLRGKVLTEVAFDIGSNDDRYWLTIPYKTDTMWWGFHRLIGQKAPSQLPVRPDLIAEVLSVGAIEKDLLKEPVPTMRFNNDQCAYMFTWQVRMSDRWVVQKEVWYDRETFLPRLVLLFDANGRIVLRAYPTRPVQVEGYDPPVKVASRYAMYFPETGSSFYIDLKTLQRKNNSAPSPASFRFPENPEVSKVIQIDE
jgi:hypothetical protein